MTGSISTPRIAARASWSTVAVGTIDGRTSRSPTISRIAVPTDRADERPYTAAIGACRRSSSRPPTAGPAANPIGDIEPKIATAVPRRLRGVASRIVASITPVFPN